MNDSPPDWLDAPPADEGSYGSPARSGSRGAPQMSAAETLAASAEFFAWLVAPDTRVALTTVLPDHVDVDVFVATAKTAVINKPSLLKPDLRSSLLVAIQKAAGQGLLPDGKQGALVPRYDTESRKYAICWQPMVWGITKLGRETGAIQSIRAVIVFRGETFRIIQGDEDTIEHVVDLDIVDEAYAALNAGRDKHGNPQANPGGFFARVRAAYCVITPVTGLPTKRWMTHQRLVSLWESSKAANGPWNSRWIDEMILKGVILFTSKWINLDTESAPAKRFQAALMTDLEIDFDRDTDALPAPQAVAALPAPGPKLDTLEAMLGKEKVSVGDGGTSALHPSTTDTQGTVASETSLPPAPDGEGAVVRDAAQPSRDPPGARAAAAGSGKAPPAAEPPQQAVDALADRVKGALAKIKDGTPAMVAKMAGGSAFDSFRKELTEAGRPELVKQLDDAVAAKAAR